MRTLLVDTDSMIYIAAATHETAVQWDQDTFSLSGDFDGASRHLNDSLAALKKRLAADVLIACLSDYDDPWRKKVLPSYKANRKDTTRKPILLKPLRDYVKECEGNGLIDAVFQRQGLEGDDCLGVLATAENPPAPVAGERIICSLDKDLKTVPGIHFNWDKDESLRLITEESADRQHMFQTLTGDTTDGYKGCPKVGPVKADKILGEATTVGDMWPKVVEAFNKAGLTEEDALTQARVARICRASDFDFKKREVKLWEPK